MMTGAFSRNVSKLFSELKLVTANSIMQKPTEKPLKETVQCCFQKRVAADLKTQDLQFVSSQSAVVAIF